VTWAARILAAGALVALAALVPARADYEKDEALETRDPDYAAALKAVAAKDWQESAKRLASVALREPDNADVHNLLAFSNRNLGRYDVAIRHYERALKLDPRHKGAHEYIGETYLKVGDLAGAERHLAILRDLCPLSCGELRDLERAIEEFRRGR
jgi:tetratricopeptide (TPR) repeat protein